MNLSVQYLTIFLIFLKLGCTSFGGPAAHLVFFHRTFVEKYRWLT
ncbi:MAG TPA: chromate transporter, partial [Acinetobacter radioresistens]|nr:chromate transporter [Acinetobacter radioresistens]